MTDRGFIGVIAALALTFVVIGAIFRKNGEADVVEPVAPQEEPTTNEGVIYTKTASNGTTFGVNQTMNDQGKTIYQVGTVNDGIFEGVLEGSTYGNLTFKDRRMAVQEVDSIVSEIDNTDPSGGPVKEPTPTPEAPPTLPPPRNDPTNPFPSSGLGSGAY